MPNIEITNNQTRGIVIWEPVFDDATLTLGAAETWPAGAILGKVTATGKYVRFATGASNGSEVPKAVLTQAVESAAAGDIAARVLINGRVRQGDIVDADDAALTAVAVDQLRDYTIIAQTTQQLAELDNQ